MHTFHVLANSAIPTSSSNQFDAHTTFIIRFCEVFVSKGHTVHFYGVDYGKYHVQHTHYHTITKARSHPNFEIISQDSSYIFTSKELNLYLDVRIRLTKIFIDNVGRELPKYYKHIVIHSFLYLTEGWEVPMINVAYCFGGYSNINSNFIYCSNWLMQSREAERKQLGHKGKATYVYPYFDPSEFIFSNQKNTFLYMSRCHKFKGIHIFLVTGGCSKYNKTTRIIYSGDEVHELPMNAEYLGLVTGDKRRELLSTCLALVQPTTYEEPLGFNVIEVNLSGTPVLAPRSGGFMETVQHGTNGYLYGTEAELEFYLLWTEKLSPEESHEHARKLVDRETFYGKTFEYFDELSACACS